MKARVKPAVVRAYSNLLKQNLTERLAARFLKDQGFLYEDYATLIETRTPDEIRERRKRLREEAKRYRRERLPSGRSTFIRIRARRLQEISVPWQEWRKEKLKSIQSELDNLKEEDTRSELWAGDLERIRDFDQGLGEFARREFGAEYTPDFIAKKDDELYVVEVKSETKKRGISKFPRKQKASLERAAEFGLKPLVIVVPIEVSFQVNLGEPRFLGD